MPSFPTPGSPMEIGIQLMNGLLIGMRELVEKNPDITGKQLVKEMQKASKIIKMFADIVDEEDDAVS